MYSDSWQIVIGVVIGLIVLFLILREFWCWYWKINKRIKLMEEQNELLKGIFEKYIGGTNIKNEIQKKYKNVDEIIVGEEYISKGKITLFENYDYKTKIICNILENERIKIIDVEENGEDIWFFIKDRDGNEG
jgi:hypothetical protein